MTIAQVRGIAGLLNGILSPTEPAGIEQRRMPQPSSSPRIKEPLPAVSPIAVRRGRPPGSRQASTPKEKVTVWIKSSLIGSYRDWTWQERCQLSHLVERALTDYHEQHRQEPAKK
jgi:hypothetical protein